MSKKHKQKIEEPIQPQTRLKEPQIPFPLEEGVCRLEKRQEQFHVFMDYSEAVILLHLLFWWLREQPFGEEISFSDRPFTPAKKDTSFQYCEFHLIPRRPSSPEPEKNGIFTPEQGRLDYYVGLKEVERVYTALSELLERPFAQEKTFLFATLQIHIKGEASSKQKTTEP